MNRKVSLVCMRVACGAMVLAAGSCLKKKSGPPPAHPMAVQAAPAVKMDVPVTIRAFGTTEPRMSVDLVPQVSGMLITTFIADGAVVTNGQPLFQLDPRDYEARVRQGEALVAADRANLELSRVTLDRNQPLLAKQLIAQENFDTIKTRLAAAQAQLQADEAALDQARLNLSRCRIAAPLAGVCSKRYLDDGNLAAAGQTRLINIRSYDPITVNFTVSEDYLAILRRALAEGPVRLDIQPRGDTNSYPGALSFLDNTVSSQTGAILLRGQAPNPELKLWAGQFVEVRLAAGLIRDAVMVPEGAVQLGKQGPYLFAVSKENTADLRPVKVGVRHENRIQILGGVEPGESVVVLGQLMLAPGAPVIDVSRADGGKTP